MKTFIILLIAAAGAAHAASFEGHTAFQAQPIWGRLTITCTENGMTEWKYVTCGDTYLSPFEYAYFEAEKDNGATEVRLSSLRADGKRIEKRADYDPATGRSTKRINLWIATLLQKPILDVGANEVDYQLVDRGQVKASGRVTVTVETLPEKQCPDGREQSFSMTDCRFPEAACDRYFRRYGYCE